MVDLVAVASFTEFVRETEPKLKVALSAAFGPDLGVESAAQALAYGWEHWERVGSLSNPAGYLWGVGRNHARRLLSRRRRLRETMFESVPVDGIPGIEPGLTRALAGLSEKQRVSVVMVKGLGWTLSEVADLLQISVPTVQTHVGRAMKHLRRELGANS